MLLIYLAPEVGPNYLVKIEVRLYLHELSVEERWYFGRADIGITLTSEVETPSPRTNRLTAPVQMRLPAVAVERHSSLEIFDRRNRRLVTVIGVLSPTNKTHGPDRDEYLAKRAQ